MDAVEDLAQQAKQLPPQERRRLIDEIEASLDEQEAAEGPADRPYSRSLALAGTVHSDFTDLSTDKYKHVADAADPPDRT